MTWHETSFTLTCDRSGVDHTVTVALPLRYERLESAPVLFCLDGAWVAGAVRDATRLMSMSGEAPEAIVVGLSFTDSTMSAYLRSRVRWYTPTQWVPPPEVGVKDIVAADAGHAETYLAFLAEQVMPAITEQYRCGDRWLVGHSFSALFGLRTLLTQPELFSKYLLASPSIWWHDRAIHEVERSYAERHDDLAAHVFMTAGELEAGLDEVAAEFGATGFNMAANMIAMRDQLVSRGYPSLRIDHVVLPSESHSSTVGAAVSRGIRALMG